MIIGLTGANGFLGWHLRCRFELAGHDVRIADRATFGSDAALDQFVRASDAILHAAGVNRSNDIDEVSSNVQMAEQLVAAMRRTGRSPTTIYTNSIQADAPDVNLYGEAKAAAARVIASHMASSGARFVDLLLPHLFGGYGRPYYNSAVTTFAHQLSVGEKPTVNDDGQLELLHAQDVAVRILELLTEAGPAGCFRERLVGRSISVLETWQLLERLHIRYVEQSTIPATSDVFELRMFNTLRSHMYLNGLYPRPVTLHVDERGAFAELCRADGLGQTSISTTAPGVTRGDHFHLDKVERFVVVDGEATIRLRRLHTNEVSSYQVSGEAPMIVDMPELTTHNITNTGDRTMTTVFWAGDHFDSATPDTYGEPVALTDRTSR